MTDVTKHISELLYLHDCVIIPAFGGLVANPTAALLDADRHVFTPPGKEIGFNRSLQHNDGLLINYLAKQQGRSYEQAKQIVTDYVGEVLDKLDKKELVSFSGIGDFVKDSFGNVIFRADRNENFLTASFGLSPLHVSPVIPVARRMRETQQSVRRAIRPHSRKQLAASVALVLGLFLFSPEIKTPEFNRAGGLEFLAPAEVRSNNEDATIGLDEISDPEDKNPTLVEEPGSEVKDNYFIIAGSFKKVDQANAFCQQLTQSGRANPIILSSAQGRFRVAVNAYGDKQQAIKALNEYRTESGISSAWLLKKQ